MLRIIVVEDDKNMQFTIRKILRDMSIFKNEELKIEYFTKFSSELKEIIKDTSEPKIFIMDIELESQISGIDIAKYIREIDWESEIIFLTNHDKMFETAYRSVYEIFDFIEKFHDMESRLKKDLKVIFKRNYDNKMFKFNCRNYNLKLYYHSITYIYRDKNERKLIVNTDKTHYAITMNVTDCINYLDDRFKMVHRSCIVNTERVAVYNWTKGFFILDNGTKVPMLSKKYRKEIEENE